MRSGFPARAKVRGGRRVEGRGVPFYAAATRVDRTVELFERARWKSKGGRPKQAPPKHEMGLKSTREWGSGKRR